MFELYAKKNVLTARQREPVTSGSVNVCLVRFEFSEDWAGLTKTAVFKAGLEARSVPLGDSGECAVPWEVLRLPRYRLCAGVYGVRGGELVLPTVWADLGTILEGASPGREARPPAPPPGGGEGGAGDHRQLSHRDAEAQHPISAIDGLEGELMRIPAPAEALTNEELEGLLK